MSGREGPVLWTAADAGRATGGRGDGTWRATGVSIDSRTLVPGDLFVAVRGPNFDGNGFAADALAKGAAAAMVDRHPAGPGRDGPLLMVDDTRAGLRSLAAEARARSGARIVAVTGSVGKTGTKEALRHVLARQRPTHASAGNLNNEWGLPLSLARMPAETAYGVFEMGMSHAGEIEPLSRLARPDVAVITAVEVVHRAHFESVDEIALAKAEVFAGLAADGVAVLNRDNPHFARLAAAAHAAGVGAVIDFGAHEDARVRLLWTEPAGEGSHVRARVDGRDVAYRVGAAGRHWVTISLSVLAVAAALGADVAAAAADLAEARAPAGRGRRIAVLGPGGAFVLVDESYNASPASVTAALATLGETAPGAGGRRIAVLGDMLELGAEAERLHEALAQPIGAHGIDLVFTAGPLMACLWKALPEPLQGAHAHTSERLTPIVGRAVRAGDVVMVKGSLGSRMGPVVEGLAALGSNGRTALAPARAVVGR